MIRSVTAALAAAVLLTACASGSDSGPAATTTPVSKAVTPKPGDCFADADSKLDLADPDFSTKVKCTASHLYEVTGVSPVPARFVKPAAGPDDPGATVRDRLLEADVPVDRRFEHFVDTTCSSHLWHTMGVEAEDIRSGTSRLSEVGAYPATLGISYRYTLTPEPEWSKGNHALICFAEFRDPSDDPEQAAPTPVRSYNLRLVAGRFLRSNFPSERRQCLVASEETTDEYEIGACAQAHEAETILTYNARLAFGSRFVKEAIRAEGKDDKILDRIDKVCRDILPKVLARPIDSELYVWGWSAFEAFDPDSYMDLTYDSVECQVWPADEDLVLAPGTVVHRPDRPELEHRSYRSDA